MLGVGWPVSRGRGGGGGRVGAVVAGRSRPVWRGGVRLRGVPWGAGCGLGREDDGGVCCVQREECGREQQRVAERLGQRRRCGGRGRLVAGGGGLAGSGLCLGGGGAVGVVHGWLFGSGVAGVYGGRVGFMEVVLGFVVFALTRRAVCVCGRVWVGPRGDTGLQSVGGLGAGARVVAGLFCCAESRGAWSCARQSAVGGSVFGGTV